MSKSLIAIAGAFVILSAGWRIAPKPAPPPAHRRSTVKRAFPDRRCGRFGALGAPLAPRNTLPATRASGERREPLLFQSNRIPLHSRRAVAACAQPGA